MSNLIKLDSYGLGNWGYTWDNGIRLSLSIRWGSYSDNHDFPIEDKKPDGYESATFEAMVTAGEPQFIDTFKSIYESNPAGYIEAKELPNILALCANYKPVNDPETEYEVTIDYENYHVYESQREWFEQTVLPKVKASQALPSAKGDKPAKTTDAKPISDSDTKS